MKYLAVIEASFNKGDCKSCPLRRTIITPEGKFCHYEYLCKLVEDPEDCPLLLVEEKESNEDTGNK